jgi:hypothetical protein
MDNIEKQLYKIMVSVQATFKQVEKEYPLIAKQPLYKLGLLINQVAPSTFMSQFHDDPSGEILLYTVFQHVARTNDLRQLKIANIKHATPTAQAFMEIVENKYPKDVIANYQSTIRKFLKTPRMIEHDSPLFLGVF